MKSVLTISKDFSYGEIVRIVYLRSPTQTYHLPSFIGAIRTTQIIQPDFFILDLCQEDFLPAKSFLTKLLDITNYNSSYNPNVCLGETAAAILQAQTGTAKFPPKNYILSYKEEISIAVKLFQVEQLIEQLEISIQMRSSIDHSSY